MLLLSSLSLGLAPSQLLDPLALINTKGSQSTTPRLYVPAAQNGGLETATLALVSGHATITETAVPCAMAHSLPSPACVYQG